MNELACGVAVKKNGLNSRAKILIAIALFAVVFVTLVCVATYFDLKISDILTSGALKDGDYYASDFFGVAGEIIGSAPVFLLLAFCASVLCLYFARIWKLKPLKYILALAFFALGIVAFWFFVKDITGYIMEHAAKFAGNFAELDEFRHSAAVVFCEVAVAFILNAVTVLACNNMKDDTIRKLCKFVIAAIVGVIVANVIIMLVKVPAGRMRYRAMNSALGQSMGGFENFTKWFVLNGQPDKATLDAFEAAYGVTDAFKSFPSGHTCAAGMTYALILLPDVLGIRRKGVKFACWSLPVIVTGLVGISRIVCGAHYMSDITFGGTIAFLSMLLAREIFICKFSHFKALFGKKKTDLSDEPQCECAA